MKSHLAALALLALAASLLSQPASASCNGQGFNKAGEKMMVVLVRAREVSCLRKAWGVPAGMKHNVRGRNAWNRSPMK